MTPRRPWAALAAGAALLALACGVKALPRAAGAPDRAPPPGVFTAPGATSGPVGAAAPVNPAPPPPVPCQPRAGEETCR